MKKDFDAVKMTREIRDQIYEETKYMSWEERKKYYNREADKLHRKLNIRKEQVG